MQIISKPLLSFEFEDMKFSQHKVPENKNREQKGFIKQYEHQMTQEEIHFNVLWTAEK